LERLEALPSALPVDARVLPIGDPDDSGLAPRQLAGRLARLPTIGRVPRLGVSAQHTRVGGAPLAAPFRPLVRWIVDDLPHSRTAGGSEPAPEHASTDEHIANRLYRETSAR